MFSKPDIGGCPQKVSLAAIEDEGSSKGFWVVLLKFRLIMFDHFGSNGATFSEGGGTLSHK